MPKLIARAFSDIHIHDYAQFNKEDIRIKHKFNLLRELSADGVPLLFGGDFFHEDQQISNKILDYCSQELPEIFSETQLIGISGNHEMNEMNKLGQMSPSLFRSICNFVPNMYCVDFRQKWLNKDTAVFGIPYINYNMGLGEVLDMFYMLPEYREAHYKILLIHSDLHGAKDTDGRKIGSVENLPIRMDEFFNFDLILCGHIHKPQRITKKIIMIGAPDQQRKSDMGGKFGYWDIYSDMSYKFRKLKYPEFKTYDPSKDEIDDFHYWVAINSEKEEDLLYEERRFTNNISRKLLAKRYCKEKGIKDKKRINALKDVLND
jgi:DNA repair exonuclease SbcCD nuclease subunit